MKRYVVGFAFNATEDRVLLISKTHPEWQAGRLNGVGGHVEGGETDLQAMIREFEKKTNGTVSAWRRFCTLSGDGFVVVFFRGIAHDLCGGRTDEQTVWTDPTNLPESVLPNLRWLVPMAGSRQAHDWPFEITERAGGTK